MDLTDRQPGIVRRNTYEFIKDAFGDHSANVLINTSIVASGVPVAGGVWDAAFDRLGNKPLGFDLAGSPFGIDPFDMFPFNPLLKHGLRYRDVFTGLVFTHPTKNHVYQFGIPGYYDGFESEAIRRAGCVSEEHRSEVEDNIRWAGHGDIPRADRFPSALQFQTYVELILFGIAGVGLLIGSSAFALSLRNRRCGAAHSA
jgi:hypothetical protein